MNSMKTEMKLKSRIELLIQKHSEGSYWDFKQNWHSDNVDLLKDIVCMANNTTADMRDAYIIFGVEDGTFSIKGVSEDSNRKNQENIIGFLGSKTWAGEEIPNVQVNTIELDGKEVDVLIIYNSTVTPYYLLKDYMKSTDSGKQKKILSAGVIYSRVGDRNTSSAECATKQAMEFLWKKRFGLAGTDENKVAKRLQNTDTWYSTDENNTFYNSEYDDIIIKRAQYMLEVCIGEERPETSTWVMDFPYLFTNVFNWDMGKSETGRRAKWNIYLNGRELPVSLYGVQSTLQSYYHIEPKTYWDNELGIFIHKAASSIKYYAYIQDSIEFLAFKLFFDKQCYQDKELSYSKALMIIPVFKNEQEHLQFMQYVKSNSAQFRVDVDEQVVDEMYPEYAQKVNRVVIYKFCKTLVQWLDRWRDNELT